MRQGFDIIKDEADEHYHKIIEKILSAISLQIDQQTKQDGKLVENLQLP